MLESDGHYQVAHLLNQTSSACARGGTKRSASSGASLDLLLRSGIQAWPAASSLELKGRLDVYAN